MQLSELADQINAELLPHTPEQGLRDIESMASLEDAQANQISFLASPKYRHHLETTQAGAVIVSQPLETHLPLNQLVVKSPYLAVAQTLQLLYPQTKPTPSRSPQASIDPSASLAADVVVSPGVTIGPQAVIGSGCILQPGCFIGAHTQLGEDCVIHPNAVIGERCSLGDRVIVYGCAVIGADGFGYARDHDGRVIKIPQVGRVVIEDDVEVGACATVDRAALGVTYIRRGTRLDSQVHVGHNADIGEQSLFSANTSIAGSARIGKMVTTGGLAGVAGHLQVGEGAQIGAMTGVIKDVAPGEVCLGFPAQPARHWRKQQAAVKKLGEMQSRVRQLEKQLAELIAKQQP